jgi:hypothetical protein
MIQNLLRTDWEPNAGEKLLAEQMVGECKKLEKQVKCRRCQVRQLKSFLDLLERSEALSDELPTRRVRKDNTILYKGHPYSVPFGTYLPSFQVHVKVKEQYGMLMIVRPFDDQLLTLHPVIKGKPAHNTMLLDDPQLPLF